MKIFFHHIYEYKKGVRRMILHTLHESQKEEVIKRLKKNDIPFIITDVTNHKFNVFFGNKYCIEVVSHFAHKPLNTLTDEEDFILGTLLGYDTVGQCERFVRRKYKICKKAA